MKNRKKKKKSLVPLSLALGLLIGVTVGGVILAVNHQRSAESVVSTVKTQDKPNKASIEKESPLNVVEVEDEKLEEAVPEVAEPSEMAGKMPVELDHTVCKKLGYCIHKAKDEGLEDESNFKKEVVTEISDINVLKSKIAPLYKEKKLEEILGYLDSYTGPEQGKIKELRKVLELQIFAANKIAESRGPLKPLSKNPRKELVVDHEAIAREEQRRKTIERELRVHNEIVGIGEDKLIVFSDRGAVIRYSKLIKACENKASKFFDERKQKAVDFLEEHKDSIDIIPHNKQKVKIRQGGGMVCQVYYGTSIVDEYGYTNSRRNIGYILTYDLKPLPMTMVAAAGGGGC